MIEERVMVRGRMLLVRGVQSLAEMSAAQRIELVEAMARVERALGGLDRVEYHATEAGLEVWLSRHAGDPARITTGEFSSPLLDPIFDGLASAESIWILAAFVMTSGVRTLQDRLVSALQRGAAVRVITGDYLGRTRPQALRELLTLRDIYTNAQDVTQDASAGSLEVRVVQMSTLGPNIPSFHPKAWLFEGGAMPTARAYVGSSNLSRAALRDGVEWNMRLDQFEDPAGFEQLRGAFHDLWARADHVNHAWISEYVTRAEVFAPRVEQDQPTSTHAEISPRPIQQAALDALEAARARGQSRALVVLATGLGKTFLAAFDALQVERDLGRPVRVLFIAHRIEILAQAALTYERVFHDASIGFVAGALEQTDARFIFAGVQKLTRSDRLSSLGAFDYVVIDEAHHAHAQSYTEVLDRLDAGFVLGLTATPTRADGVHVERYFGGPPVYTARLAEGIESGNLVPFRYIGIKDSIDYASIPWRGRRFDPSELEALAQTTDRMDTLWRAWGEHPGERTIVFCCSVAHADFVGAWLANQGVEAAVVHSGAGSEDRAQSVDRLAEGELDAIVVVDLFNEGVDIPTVDRVVMLRPTESPVIFLQQLGRGLRCAPGKLDLCVIDFVGNHLVFLERMRNLVESLRDRALVIDDLRDAVALDATLPPGCSIQLELEAVDLLSALMPEARDSVLIAHYLAWRERHGVRPRAAELATLGVNPWAARAVGGWFALVHEQGDLSEEAWRTLRDSARWFEALGAGRLDASQLSALDYLVNHFASDFGVADWRAVSSNGEVDATIASVDAVRVDGASVKIDGVTDLNIERWRELSVELLEWLKLRRARLDGDSQDEDARVFRARVIQSNGRPILKLPDRASAPEIPTGATGVLVGDERWEFRFVKIACNVATPAGETKNQLGELLRRWFGEHAGQPGTTHQVLFQQTSRGWMASPVGVVMTRRLEPGAIVTTRTLAERYGLELDQVGEGSTLARCADATLLFVRADGALSSYETISLSDPGGRDCVSVFFEQDGGGWRYHGEARRSPVREADWLIDEVDFHTWAEFGAKRGVSRVLPDVASEWASAFVLAFAARFERGQMIEGLGKQCRFVEVTRTGGIRIDGGDDGFARRSVSATDLAWVLWTIAAEDTDVIGAPQVHRRRYLSGTPKSKTRYIDTGWALVIAHALGWSAPEGSST